MGFETHLTYRIWPEHRDPAQPLLDTFVEFNMVWGKGTVSAARIGAGHNAGRGSMWGGLGILTGTL